MGRSVSYPRGAIVAFTVLEVEAEDEEQARDMMCETGDPVRTEWMDWATRDWELDDVEELDPLYRMVRDYDPAGV